MNRAPALSVAVAFMVLAAIVGAVIYYTADLQRAAGDLKRNFGLSSNLLELLATVQDAESGERGFLLTGREDYLEPYEAARSRVGERLLQLEDETSIDEFLAGKATELAIAVQTRLRSLDEAIEAYRLVSPQAAIEIVGQARGLDQMMAIRALLDEMLAYQAAALDAAFAARDLAAFRLQVSVAFGALAVVIVGVFAVWSAHGIQLGLERQTRLAEARAVELETVNNDLRAEAESRAVVEDQLRQVQKMEAIGQLTGGVAHDFNNMLAVVISAVGLIRRKLARGETDIEKFLDGAVEAAERSAVLTRRLLAFSRQQALDPRPLDANKLVAGMSELLRRTLGEAIELESVLAGGLWRINADAAELESAIINLAANARDAMEGAGRITIETANCFLDEVYGRDNPEVEPGQYVLIAVSDTGPGMTPTVLARAFDPFFTTKPVGRGTGLGLSQVYGFIKQSKGHIKIYSEQGNGTAVKMYLPRFLGADVDAPHHRAAAVGALPTANKGEVVLVTEDDDRVRALAIDSLAELGYTVLDAHDGQEALRLLEGHPEVSLLFTDIVMPRMSGRELADMARKTKPDLKVLYTTGFTRNAVVHNGVLDPGLKYLQKPFTLAELAARVREAIDD